MRRTTLIAAVVWLCVTASLASGQAFVAPAVAPLQITPADDSENPVQVGQLVILDVSGLADPSRAQAGVWPPEDVEFRAILGDVPQGVRWQSWGTSPRLLFRASIPGRFLVQVRAAESIVDYEVTVEGTPPPEPSFRVDPVAHFESSGKQGGPFTPRVMTYTLTALGAPADWTATADSPWLVVSPESGTLAPDASVGIDVMIGSAADKLAEGSHSVDIDFRSGGKVLTRKVLLTVGENDPVPPPPGPVPKKERWAVIIEETSERTAKHAVVLTSKVVRDYFPEYQFLVKDDDVQGVTDNLQWYIDEAREHGLPCLFLVRDPDGINDAKVLYKGPLPDTVAGFESVIRPFVNGDSHTPPRPDERREPVILRWKRVCDPNGECRWQPVWGTAP